MFLYQFHFEGKIGSWKFQPTFVELNELSLDLLNLACEMFAIFILSKAQVKTLLANHPDTERKNLLMLAIRSSFDPVMFSCLVKADTKKVIELTTRFYHNLIADKYFNNFDVVRVDSNLFTKELTDFVSHFPKLLEFDLQTNLDHLVLNCNLVVRDVENYSLYDISKIIVPLEVRLIFNRDPEKKINELREENPDLVSLYEDRVLDRIPETLLMRYLRVNFPNETNLYKFCKKFYDRKVDYQQLRENFDLNMLDEKILRAIKYWRPESTDFKKYKYTDYLKDIESDNCDRDALLLHISSVRKSDSVEDWITPVKNYLE